MGWTVQGLNPSGGEVFIQTGPGAHPASCAVGTSCLLGVKRPGRGIDIPNEHVFLERDLFFKKFLITFCNAA